MYDASNPRHLRKQLKVLKAQEAQDAGVLANLMSSPAGRAWLYNLLADCHVFHSSFNEHSGKMSFNEGERNVGLKLFLSIVKHCPEPYIQMMREANDRDQTNGRNDDNDRRSGPIEGIGWDPSGTDGDVESDYEPDPAA